MTPTDELATALDEFARHWQQGCDTQAECFAAILAALPDGAHLFTVDSLATALQADTSTLNVILRRSGRANAVFWQQEAERLIQAAEEAKRE